MFALVLTEWSKIDHQRRALGRHKIAALIRIAPQTSRGSAVLQQRMSRPPTKIPIAKLLARASNRHN
jgi:hypothetical protein